MRRNFTAGCLTSLLLLIACPEPSASNEAGTPTDAGEAPDTPAGIDRVASADRAGSDRASSDDTGSAVHDGAIDPDASAGADSSAVPDRVVRDVLVRDTVFADQTVPDAGLDRSSPDVTAVDTFMPDVAVPDTAAPDSATPDHASPDVTAPDLVVPDTGADDTATADSGPAPLCEGEPCLTAVLDENDWSSISDESALGRCDIDQESKFLAPAIPGAALQETVYQDVEVYPYHLEFMREVLDEYFAGLPPDTYYQLVQRRATRQYWAGSLLRIMYGETLLGYAFHVIVDPIDPLEQLTQEEIIEIHDLLTRTFELPLAYAPVGAAAIETARSFVNLPFSLFLPTLCPSGSCDDPEVNCIEVPAATQLCGHFQENRSVQGEYAVKHRLQMAEGTVNLPMKTTEAPVEMTLFVGGAFSPDQVPMTIFGPGEMQATINGLRVDYAYQQTLLAGADVITLSWEFNLPLDGGKVVLEEPYLTQQLFLNGVVNEGAWPDDILKPASCSYEALPLFQGRGLFQAPGGGQTYYVSFEYRHQIPMAGSGPFEIVQAEIGATGPLVEQDDYFKLVYAGVHHNWDNQFWILFDQPIQFLGHPVYGLWIDEFAHACCDPETGLPDGIYTMDADFMKLDDLKVIEYERPYLP